MNQTQIKRLYQNSLDFVPITLSEAVVVNTSNIIGLNKLGITTLDKVLRVTLGVVGTNSADIVTLNDAVKNINTELNNKQDKLTPGTGISISKNGVISVTGGSGGSISYKIVTKLPAASKECLNTIYLVKASSVTGNLFKEYLCIFESSRNIYIWEELGEIKSDIDLSGYVTNDTFEAKLKEINLAIVSKIDAKDITTSNGVKVTVKYTIPKNLYDSLMAQ